MNTVGLLLGISNLRYMRVNQVCVCVYTYEILLSAGIQTSASSPHVPPIRVDLFLKPNTVLFLFGVLVPDFSF